MPLREHSDESLMNLYVLGNQKAFDVLYARYRRQLYGYIRSKVQKKEIADEIFQSTFFNLHRSRQRYKQGLRFDAWIFSICRNCMFDYFRRKKTSEREVEAFDEEWMSAPAREVEGDIDVNSQIGKLSPEQQDILQQRVVEEREFVEIARALRTTQENVRQVLSRTLRKLRKEFENGRSKKR